MNAAAAAPPPPPLAKSRCCAECQRGLHHLAPDATKPGARDVRQQQLAAAYEQIRSFDEKTIGLMWAMPARLELVLQGMWCAAAMGDAETTLVFARRIQAPDYGAIDTRRAYERLVETSNITDSRALMREARHRFAQGLTPKSVKSAEVAFGRLTHARHRALLTFERLVFNKRLCYGRSALLDAVMSLHRDDTPALQRALDQRHLRASAHNNFLVYRAVDLEREDAALCLLAERDVNVAHADYQLIALAASAAMVELLDRMLDRAGAQLDGRPSRSCAPASGYGEFVEACDRAMRIAFRMRQWRSVRTIVAHRFYSPPVEMREFGKIADSVRAEIKTDTAELRELRDVYKLVLARYRKVHGRQGNN